MTAYRSVLVMLVMGLPAVALAGEPTCDTFITSAPYAISTQGHYCLASDLAYSNPSGAAITINVNSVVFDLRGYKIGGQAAGTDTGAIGVYVPGHSAVVVRNGLVRGFFDGVELQAGVSNDNNLVEGIRADGNTRYGIFVQAPGSNNIVRDCIVGNTSGTPLTAGLTGGIPQDAVVPPRLGRAGAVARVFRRQEDRRHCAIVASGAEQNDRVRGQSLVV